MIKKIFSTPLYLIVLVNLLLKLAMFCYISPWDKNVAATKVIVSDSKGYEQVAENLLKYHSFAAPKDTININNFSEYKETGFLMWYPDGWMMPAYPVFLAGIYSMVGVKPYVAIFIQILLSLISVVLVYRICMLLFKNAKIATIAALLFALDIHSVYSANELLTDTLFVLLFLAGIYYFLKGMISGKFLPFFVGVIFMGLTCLIRLVGLLYPVVLIFVLFAFSKQNWNWKLKAILSYVIIFAFMNGMWSLRNHKEYGHWEITTHGGWTLLMFNAGLTEAYSTHQNLDSIRVSFQRQCDSLGFRKSKDIFQQSAIYKKIGTDYIMKHKGQYILTNIQGCVNMFLSLGNRGMAQTFGWTDKKPDEDLADITTQRIGKNFNSDIRETMLGILIVLIMAVQYMGAVYGIIQLGKARNFMFLSLMLLTVLYYMGITGILGNYRFKLPIVPFICIAAGYGYGKKRSIDVPIRQGESTNHDIEDYSG